MNREKIQEIKDGMSSILPFGFEQFGGTKPSLITDAGMVLADIVALICLLIGLALFAIGFGLYKLCGCIDLSQDKPQQDIFDPFTRV